MSIRKGDKFPGVGFKFYAKETQEIFDVTVDGTRGNPFSPHGSYEHPDSSTDGARSNGDDDSVPSSCFDQVVELQDQQFGEGDVSGNRNGTQRWGAPSCPG